MSTTRLHVRHETRYDYEARVAYSVQRLHLTPSAFASQRVEQWAISAPGIDTALVYTDGFGNRVHVTTVMDFTGPVTIVAEGVVHSTDASGIVKGLISATPDAVYLRQTKATQPSAAMKAMSERISAKRANSLETLHLLMAGIHEHVTYELGTTHTHTTAAEAYADGRGVCQDHAHIFAGTARAMGIPARYVTGYLVIGEGASSTAAHAWAEAFVPDLGWVGFDPANCKCPTDHYVRVAAGLDAAGAAPIRGARRGGLSEAMAVEVKVEIAQQ
ncbi:MAG: transglutaminase domain-containing protein [Aestuariivirga sp.]